MSVASFPMCIDFLPDGRLLVEDSARRRLLRREPDGSMVTDAELAPVSEKPWNDIMLDEGGNAHVNSIGFDFPGGVFAPGFIVLVTTEGAVRRVADDLGFPDGMAVTADGATLIVAESDGSRLAAYDIGPDGDLANRRLGGRRRRPPGRDLCRRRGRPLVGRRGEPALRAGARGR